MGIEIGIGIGIGIKIGIKIGMVERLVYLFVTATVDLRTAHPPSYLDEARKRGGGQSPVKEIGDNYQ